MSFFKKNFFLIVVFILVIITACATSYRFYVLKDYVIEYETECDPYTESCFISCENESCDEVFYYKYITRHAREIFDVCGADITDCEEATACYSDSGDCDVEFCDVNSDECDSMTVDNIENIDVDLENNFNKEDI